MDNNVYFEKNGYVFNYRVGAVIKKGDKILVQEHKQVDYYSLLGGRCEMGEDSISAILRELKEESGLDGTVTKPIAVIENFFVSPYNGKDYHEMFFAYEIEFNDKSIYDKEELETIEEDKKDYVKYVWKSIDELSKCDFRPNVLLDIIKKDEFTHYINVDESIKVLRKEKNQ